MLPDLDGLLDEEEQEAMDGLNSAAQRVKGLSPAGLCVNQSEFVHALHTLQGFVIQHALHRCFPDEFGGWYGERDD